MGSIPHRKSSQILTLRILSKFSRWHLTIFLQHVSIIFCTYHRKKDILSEKRRNETSRPWYRCLALQIEFAYARACPNAEVIAHKASAATYWFWWLYLRLDLWSLNAAHHSCYREPSLHVKTFLGGYLQYIKLWSDAFSLTAYLQRIQRVAGLTVQGLVQNSSSIANSERISQNIQSDLKNSSDSYSLFLLEVEK